MSRPFCVDCRGCAEPCAECAAKEPPKLADGTDARRYQPMPGDTVSVDCKGIAAQYDQHGTRIGTVVRLGYAHNCDVALVQLPGWAGVLYLDPEWLTLVYRAKPERGL